MTLFSLGALLGEVKKSNQPEAIVYTPNGGMGR